MERPSRNVQVVPAPSSCTAGAGAAFGAVAMPVDPDCRALHRPPVCLREPFAGRAFCALPMLSATGLPCHVDGCFRVPSNRMEPFHTSHMSAADANAEAQADVNADVQWNVAVTREVLAPALCALVQHQQGLLAAEVRLAGADKLASTMKQFYACWPRRTAGIVVGVCGSGVAHPTTHRTAPHRTT